MIVWKVFIHLLVERILMPREDKFYNEPDCVTAMESIQSQDTKYIGASQGYGNAINPGIVNGPSIGMQSSNNFSFDPVNKPEHYNRKGIECIQAIEAALTEEEFLGYLRGSAMKYQWRCRYKGKPVQDVEKNVWYSNKLVETLKKYGKAEPNG